MPLYDIDCQDCGYQEDVIRTVEERRTCPECGEHCDNLIRPVMAIGIIGPDSIEVNKGLGTRWETNEQKRAWQKAHPKAQPMVKGSPEEKDFSFALKDKAELAAKKLGHKNERAYQKEGRKKQRFDREQR
jgi:putative FmdB family regulatory protein|tara:strand:- start:1032 stop:1421 length:390 start_codon:yes stop_codon:yes gene_type:complete